MPVDHYENFPVASIVLPKSLRKPIETVYRFARSADDIADNDQFPTIFKIQRLAFFRKELDHIEAQETPTTPLFSELSHVIHRYQVPIHLFYDLIDAFESDINFTNFHKFEDLAGYCDKSANPVGRIVLNLFNYASDDLCKLSDKICTSLQIINFLQDIPKDYEIGRIYLPTEEQEQFSITEDHFKNQIFDQNWFKFMEFQVQRVRQFLTEGAPLYERLPGRMGLEIKAIVKSGLRVTEKISAARGNVFFFDHRIGKLDTMKIIMNTLFK